MANPRKEALDPTTPPERLQQLAESPHPNVKKAVAANPNTPLDALLLLAEQFPEKFLTNPAVPVFFLEDASFLRRAPRSACYRLLQISPKPQWLAAALLAHPNTEIRFIFAKHEKTTPEELTALSKDPSHYIRESVAAHTKTTPALLTSLAEDEHLGVVYAVAKNPNTPTETLRGLATQDLTEYTRRTRNPDKSEVLTNVKRNLQPRLAKNPNTPLEVLRDFAAMRSEGLCYTLATNPRLPVDTIREMFDSPCGDIAHLRRLFAKNPNTPADILAPLLHDPHEEVRQNLATNPSTPHDVLEALSRESNVLKRCVAMNHSAPTGVLQALAKEKNARIRQGVASNPFTDEDTRLLLARDQIRKVRYQLLKAPNMTGEVLAILSRDQSPELRHLAEKMRGKE